MLLYKGWLQFMNSKRHQGTSIVFILLCFENKASDIAPVLQASAFEDISLWHYISKRNQRCLQADSVQHFNLHHFAYIVYFRSKKSELSEGPDFLK